MLEKTSFIAGIRVTDFTEFTCPRLQFIA